MDENVDDKIYIINQCWQHTFFLQKLEKETRWKKYMLVYFEKFNT
jgi:hypothetical protein